LRLGRPEVALELFEHGLELSRKLGTDTFEEAFALNNVAAANEALGRLYHDRFGMEVICLRIGTWFEKPGSARGLATWMSPDDGARLVEASLATRDPGFRIVWGISRNTRRWWSLAEGEAIGYHPVDDAEKFASEYLNGAEPDLIDPVHHLLGGQFCAIPLGERR
jgi:hypothetical protein